MSKLSSWTTSDTVVSHVIRVRKISSSGSTLPKLARGELWSFYLSSTILSHAVVTGSNISASNALRASIQLRTGVDWSFLTPDSRDI